MTTQLRAFLILILILLAGCEDSKRLPGQPDEDDQQVFKEEIMEESVDRIPICGIFTYNPDPTGAARTSFQYIGTYTRYGLRNGGRPAWRIPGPMSKFGGVCKLSFNGNGGTYYAYSQKANRGNNGVVWKRGSHGGPYIHAPYRSNATRVRIDCR